MIVSKSKERIKTLEDKIKSYPVWLSKKEIQVSDIIVEKGTLLKLLLVDKEHDTLHLCDSCLNSAEIKIAPDEFDDYFEEARDVQDQIDLIDNISKKEDRADAAAGVFFAIALIITIIALVSIAIFVATFECSGWTNLPYLLIGVVLSLICWALTIVFDKLSIRYFAQRLDVSISSLYTPEN